MDILGFLKQASTQRSILAVVGLIGWQLSPENLESIILGIGAVFAIIEGVRNDDKDMEKAARRVIVVPGPIKGDGG